MDKKRALRVIGETMREIGILMVVFAPLDAAFHPTETDPRYLLLVVMGALASIGVGIMLEIEED